MSVVANPGFESALGPLITSPPQPTYYGGWSPFQGYNAAPRQPTRVTTDKHSGTYSLRIQADSGVGKGNWVLQDFTPAQVDPDNGIFLSAWVKPVTGNEQLVLGLDYDRGPGTAAGYLSVDLTEDGTSFNAWAATGLTAPVLGFDGAWHQVGLRSFPDGASQLVFDGVTVASTGPQTVPVFSVATVLLGEGAGVFTPYTDDFYWDDIALDFSPYAVGGAAGWTVAGVRL